MDTDDVRAVTEAEEFLTWITEKKYLEVDEEHQGTDKKLEKQRHLDELKEKSRQKKKTKEQKASEL